MYIRLHLKCPLFLSAFKLVWIFSTEFRNTVKYEISWQSVQWKPSCSRQIDTQTGMKELIVIFRSFVKAPKKQRLWNILGFRGPQHCKHCTTLTCFRNALLYRRNTWVGGCGMILSLHALLPSIGRAGTYRRLTDDREFLKSRAERSMFLSLWLARREDLVVGDTLLLSATHTWQ
jgi:hypothetical protein